MLWVELAEREFSLRRTGLEGTGPGLEGTGTGPEECPAKKIH